MLHVLLSNLDMAGGLKETCLKDVRILMSKRSIAVVMHWCITETWLVRQDK